MKPMTRQEAERHAEQTSKINGRPFIVVPCVYLNGEAGWSVTPSDRAAVALGKLGGSAKSERKTIAVRENGKKGGRPKVKQTPPNPQNCQCLRVVRATSE